VDQSKTVQARITKSSASADWKTVVSGTVKNFSINSQGSPRMRALNERGGKNLRFSANKSPYLRNGSNIGLRLLLITNRKLYTGS